MKGLGMCGRFYISDEDNYIYSKLILEALKLDKKMSNDIFPSNRYPVMLTKNGELFLSVKKWGFRTSKGPSLIINARAETLIQKPMFRSSFENRRCIIKMSGFYEWDKQKNKHRVFSEESRLLDAAGLYTNFEGEEYFTIITTQANASLDGIHERMPLILSHDQGRLWLSERTAAKDLLEIIPMPLSYTVE